MTQTTTMFHFRDLLRSRLLLNVIISLGFAGAVSGAEPFEAFLEKHCLRCHGPQKEEGDVRIDQLSRDVKAGLDSHHWAEALVNKQRCQESLFGMTPLFASRASKRNVLPGRVHRRNEESKHC